MNLYKSMSILKPGNKCKIAMNSLEERKDGREQGETGFAAEEYIFIDSKQNEEESLNLTANDR